MTQSFCCTCPDEQGRSSVSSAGFQTPHDTEKLFLIVILKFKKPCVFLLPQALRINSEDRPAPIGTVCSDWGPRRLICLRSDGITGGTLVVSWCRLVVDPASVPEPITAAATTATPSSVNLRIVIFLASFEEITQALTITNLLQCTIAYIFVFKWNIHIMTQCTNFRLAHEQPRDDAKHRNSGAQATPRSCR